MRMNLVGPCLICGTMKARFVRDHNHTTGMIRGILCEQCNSWLGVYVKNWYRVNQKGGKSYNEWISKYDLEIRFHLNRNTGIPYKGSKHLFRFPQWTTPVFRDIKEIKNAT